MGVREQMSTAAAAADPGPGPQDSPTGRGRTPVAVNALLRGPELRL